MDQYRLYSFTHAWLSAGAAGLQTAHVVSELSLQNCPIYHHWAQNDKTIIILNGGSSQMLANTMDLLIAYRNKCPILQDLTSEVTDFREDVQSLENARTAVGVIVHSALFNLFDGVVQNTPDGQCYQSEYPDPLNENRIKTILSSEGEPIFEFVKLIKKHQLRNF